MELYTVLPKHLEYIGDYLIYKLEKEEGMLKCLIIATNGLVCYMHLYEYELYKL